MFEFSLCSCHFKYTVIIINFTFSQTTCFGKVGKRKYYPNLHSASGSLASILCLPQSTCRNRCLSYTPFGVGHFFKNHLIVIHFREASDVSAVRVRSNYLHFSKSVRLKPPDVQLLLFAENFSLWTETVLKSLRESCVWADFYSTQRCSLIVSELPLGRTSDTLTHNSNYLFSSVHSGLHKYGSELKWFVTITQTCCVLIFNIERCFAAKQTA